MRARLTPITGDRFEELVLKSPRPSLILFGGEACTPCHALEPLLADLAESYKGRVNFFLVDATVDMDLGIAYQVRGLPTVLIFSEKKLASRLVGLKPTKHYQSAIESCLAAP